MWRHVYMPACFWQFPPHLSAGVHSSRKHTPPSHWCSRQQRTRLDRRRVLRRDPCVWSWWCSPPRSTGFFPLPCLTQCAHNAKIQRLHWCCIVQTCRFHALHAWCRHRVLLHEWCSSPHCTLSTAFFRAVAVQPSRRQTPNAPCLEHSPRAIALVEQPSTGQGFQSNIL